MLAYSIDHSSVADGDVQREDHAMAVILQPTWKFAMILHEVGVCLKRVQYAHATSIVGKERENGGGTTYGEQHLHRVQAAYGD